MRIQTFSIVVGSSACDASCLYCVSHMTGFEALPEVPEINEYNFAKARRFAELGGCSTVLFTGKGEPTLPRAAEEVTHYLGLLRSGEQFPFIELQTNGIGIGKAVDSPDSYLHDALKTWYRLGLNTIAISVVDVDRLNNGRIYLNGRKKYPDLTKTVKFLHDLGFNVRLCLMLHKGIIDSPAGVQNVINWCLANEVEQLTMRPIRKPECTANGAEPYVEYIDEQAAISDLQHGAINELIRREGTLLMTLMHGDSAAKIYDFEGQNVCITDCLTLIPNTDDIRSLIYYSDGRLMFDWSYKGARLL